MLRSSRILRNQERLIEQFQQTNELLQSLPERLEQSGRNVIVQRLEIRQAHLDKLLFQLDNIDVQELSGTLNLGNNFQLEDGKAKVGKSVKPVFDHLLNKPAPPNQPDQSASTPVHGAAEMKGLADRTSSSVPSRHAHTTVPGNKNHMVATNNGYAVRIQQDGEGADR